MIERHELGRFVTALGAFVFVAIALPLGAIAASRARFGAANPLAGVDPPWRWFGDGAGSTLSQRVADDAVVDVLIRLSVCVILAVAATVVVTTVLEIVHLVRHRGLAMPSVRGLGWAQRIARFIATGLLVVMPMLTSTAGAASVPRAPASAFADDPAGWVHRSRSAAPEVAEEPVASPSAHAYVVRPGDSVYSIAELLARGDGQRVIAIADAIVDANLGAPMGHGQHFTNPAYVEAGWVLQIPAEFAEVIVRPPAAPSGPDQSSAGELVSGDLLTERTADDYEVQPGDTLWDIADDQLGDPTRWTEIWDRNAGDDMGGGRTFDDPNLILPGWDLDVRDEPTPPPTAAPATDEPIAPATPASEDAAVGSPVIDTDDGFHDQADRVVDPTAERVEPARPLPLTPSEPATSHELLPSPPTSEPTATTTTGVPVDPGARSTDERPTPSPDAPSTVRLEHAALLAAGILTLVGVRRRQRLRAARPRHRVPEPRPDVMATERRLRSVDAGERALRVDVACRAAAHSMIASGAQIGWVRVSLDGDVEVHTTAPVALPPPWSGDGQRWHLGAEVPIELLGDEARRVGMPCVALVQLGVAWSGDDVLVDVEACGVLAIGAESEVAAEIVTALAAGLASSIYAEVAHLIGVALAPGALLGHRNAHCADSAEGALDLATALVGTTVDQERTTFELRSLRTGGEVWEPAIVLLGEGEGPRAGWKEQALPVGGHGIGVVVADPCGALPDAPARLVETSSGWSLEAFGTSIELSPVGVTREDLAAIDEVLSDAERPLEAVELGSVDEITWAATDDTADVHLPAVDHDPMPDAAEAGDTAPFVEADHRIVVGLLGGVEIRDRDGGQGRFERSKTVELIAWLATHRERSTRSGARTALWELDVRDATFANVVSEARRGLARLVPPPEGEEWVGRTLTEQLPLHPAVVTDADLVEERVHAARLQPPAQAVDTLRPAVAMIRDMPFAGTSYLWPDAEGITSNLVLLAMTATTDFAGHALSLGDTDAVFWATGQGLKVLPGHEELIGLRMRAHARSGDLAGVRQEWESYERVVVADPWSDGEPSPKLLELRHELLS